jgi:hypothetical protein
MEFDYKNPPKDHCPNVLCGQKKEDCCWVTKVVIAAALGDDSDDSPVKPQNGAYTNKIVEYEANGAIYFYSSDGLWTKLGNKLPSAETASVEYVDSHDRAVLRDAKAFSDAGDVATLQLATTQAQVREAQVLADAKSYTDSSAATTLNDAKDYTDTEVATALQTAKDYADTQDAAVLQAAKDYTDSAASSVVTRQYVDNGDQTALTTAKNYTDSEVGALEQSLSTVATSGSYTDLSNQPVVPNIIVTNADPGEGADLQANNFIFVYGA